ncbi:mediator complex subunit MED7, partial [Ascoidea rubescens DSM 1968]
ESDLAALYPPPPPYYKFFTAENIDKAKIWLKENEDSYNDDNDETNYPKEEFRFLIPPKKPTGPHYRCFGNIWPFDDKIPTLKEQNIPQLYQDITSSQHGQDPTQVELEKLTKSLLVVFLEIIGIISINPNVYQENLERLRIILINIHHLLNEYRPHQSRDTLKLLLEKQIDIKNREIMKIDNDCKVVKDKIFKIVE